MRYIRDSKDFWIRQERAGPELWNQTFFFFFLSLRILSQMKTLVVLVEILYHPPALNKAKWNPSATFMYPDAISCKDEIALKWASISAKAGLGNKLGAFICPQFRLQATFAAWRCDNLSQISTASLKYFEDATAVIHHTILIVLQPEVCCCRSNIEGASHIWGRSACLWS